MKSGIALVCMLLGACAVRARSVPDQEACAVPNSVCPLEAGARAESIDVLALKHAQAEQVAATLRQLVLSNPRCQVLADSRTNSLIVQGPDDGRAKVRDLVQLLDVPVPEH